MSDQFENIFLCEEIEPFGSAYIPLQQFGAAQFCSLLF
jgi:hypothetical protein